jgi:hypothetical protein
MSDQDSISTLLWALKELGVNYIPSTGKFVGYSGEIGFVYPDAVTAAREVRKHQRRNEVLANQQYPQLISHHLHQIRTALPCLKPSNMLRWKKQLEELLDETEASLHSSQAR